ncbi:hypothetical protein [Vagococcus sp. WN89Y]|uniref:hypothetical protein n=1 Tax=Vagococcus sp. WN89Y TaxID=3457258 RepID=UPI003ED4C647
MAKNNSLKLHRTHYSISDATKLLGCDEQDIFHIAIQKDITFSLSVCGRWSHSKHKVRDVDAFTKHIDSLEKDTEGFSYISEFSLIKINEIKREKKLVLASTKGFFSMPPKVRNDFIYFEGQFPEYPSLLIPAGEAYSYMVKYIQVDWQHDIGLSFESEGYIERADIKKLHFALSETDVSDSKYEALSVAQQERHAVKRNEVLSVALYLYKENSSYRKENATSITDLIFNRAAEFWPDEKQPPLSHSVISKLVSSIFNKPIFTKN